MTRDFLHRFVHKEVSRHGSLRYYYREGRGPRIRLPPDYGSAPFWEAVQAATSRSERLYVLPTALSVAGQRKQRIERALKSGILRAAGLSGASAFDLTLEWALAEAERQDFRCALSGVPFFTEVQKVGARHPFAPSLDRIEPGGPYVRTNVRIVTFAMNVMLFDWGKEVFERTANGYRAHRRRNEAATSIPEPDHEVRGKTPKVKQNQYVKR